MRVSTRRIGVAALAAAPVLAAAVLLSPAAYAHNALLASTPEDGATVTSPLAVVELEFDQPVQNEFAQVAVIDAGGVPFQDGEPEIVGGTVTQAVADLPDGTYTLSYRIVSADGHPVSGTLSFTMAAGVAPADPPVPTTSDRPATDPGSGAETDSETDAETHTGTHAGTHADSAPGGDDATWIVAVVAGAALVAAVAFVVAGGRRRRETGDTEPR